MKALKVYTAFIDILEKVLEIILAVSCLLCLSVLFIQVLNRYVFGVSWPVLQFLIPLFFLWMCMIGAALAVRKSQHFKVDILSNLLNGNGEIVYRIIMSVLVLLGGAVFAWSAYGFVELGFLKKNSATGVMMVYIYISLFFSGILIVLMALDRLFHTSHSENNLSAGQASEG